MENMEHEKQMRNHIENNAFHSVLKSKTDELQNVRKHIYKTKKKHTLCTVFSRSRRIRSSCGSSSGARSLIWTEEKQPAHKFKADFFYSVSGQLMQ